MSHASLRAADAPGASSNTDDADNALEIGQLTTVHGVEHAVGRNELSVEYQPIFALATGEAVGAEALLRWMHPEFGPLAPASFIPASEASGAIVPLGRFVLDTAVEAAAQWGLSALEVRPFLAVNVSGRELAESAYAAYVIDLCERFGIVPGGLRLEVIETFFDVTADMVEANLRALRSHGVVIVVDDFGSGFSDHLRIASLGASVIKIDRSLTQTIRGPGNPLDTAELASILADAASRSIEVIAEGVETIDQVGWLTAHGCESAQGFYFSPAISADEIAQLMAKGGRAHVAA